jgi:hypothetical protein
VWLRVALDRLPRAWEFFGADGSRFAGLARSKP